MAGNTTQAGISMLNKYQRHSMVFIVTFGCLLTRDMDVEYTDILDFLNKIPLILPYFSVFSS